MADDNVQADATIRQEERRVWITPVVITASAPNETDHALNTVSDGTGNLFS
jgi:hypothetical protein